MFLIKGLLKMIVYAVVLVVVGYVVRYEAAKWLVSQSPANQAAIAQKAADQVPAAMETAEQTMKAISPTVVSTIQNIVESFAARVHAQQNTAAKDQQVQQTEGAQGVQSQYPPATVDQQQATGQGFKHFSFEQKGGKE